MSADFLPPDVAVALDRLDDLVSEFEANADAAMQDRLLEVLRSVDVIHRGALHRLGELLDAHGLREDALVDPHVALLFGLYEAQDDDEDDEPRRRAEAAVAELQPYVASHGGRLEVVAAEGGVVNVRLLGACQSCSGSTAALNDLVEQALRANLPEFVRMDVAPSAAHPPPARAAAPVLIPLSALQTGPAAPHGGCGSTGGCGTGGRCGTCG